MAEQLELFPEEETTKPAPTPIPDAEWCFQFFNKEPNVFSNSK